MTFIGSAILFIQKFKLILLMWVFVSLLCLAIEKELKRMEEVEKE